MDSHAAPFYSSFWWTGRNNYVLGLAEEQVGYYVINNFIVLLILLEIIVGVLNSVLRVPVPISALHTAVAAALIGFMFYALAENHQIKEKA